MWLAEVRFFEVRIGLNYVIILRRRSQIFVKFVTFNLKKEIASQKLELPLDRLGDLVILSGRDVVLGKTPAHHDLSALKVGLRSHGGRYEEMVPFVFSHPLSENYTRKALGDPRNFHIFDYTINGLNR